VAVVVVVLCVCSRCSRKGPAQPEGKVKGGLLARLIPKKAGGRGGDVISLAICPNLPLSYP